MGSGEQKGPPMGIGGWIRTGKGKPCGRSGCGFGGPIGDRGLAGVLAAAEVALSAAAFFDLIGLLAHIGLYKGSRRRLAARQNAQRTTLVQSCFDGVLAGGVLGGA
jgi:hypothetical protein